MSSAITDGHLPAVQHDFSAEELRQKNRHIAYLDGLRGIAILAVMMVHASIGLGLDAPVRNLAFYGVRGVQLFFIVSGMTLTLAHRDRPLALADFAARRFFRVAPMFYLGVALYMMIGAWTRMGCGTHGASLLDVVATMLFLHGWLPDAYNKIVPGGWSIAAEAMFYLMFPAILAVSRHPQRLAALVVASYLVAGATNLMLLRLLPPGPESKGFAMMFWLCQVPAFAGGCLLAVAGEHFYLGRRAARLVLFGAIGAIVVDSQLRGHSNLLVAMLLLTIFVWAIANVRPAILQSGVLPYLGRISFSLYILHFAVMGVVDYAWRFVAWPVAPIAVFGVTYLATLVLAVAAATLTYRYVEQPFIRLGRRIATRSASAGPLTPRPFGAA